MKQFDVLHVNSLKNDGSLDSTNGTYNHAHISLDYGTLTGNDNFYLYPHQCKNTPHVHLYGDLNGFILTVHVMENNNYPDGWSAEILDGYELMLTLRSSSAVLGNEFYTYWNSVISGPKQIDWADGQSHTDHGMLINWWNGTADATHMFSIP